MLAIGRRQIDRPVVVVLRRTAGSGRPGSPARIASSTRLDRRALAVARSTRERSAACRPMLRSIAYGVQSATNASGCRLSGRDLLGRLLASWHERAGLECQAASMLRWRSARRRYFCSGITSTSLQCHTSTAASHSVRPPASGRRAASRAVPDATQEDRPRAVAGRRWSAVHARCERRT